MTRCSTLTLAALSLLSAVLFAAASQTDLPTIKTDVRQVLVPVVVTDKAGHYVSDLGREDFSVFENDVPQSIVAFSRSEPTRVTQASGGPVGRSAEVVIPKASQPPDPTRTYL